MDAVLRASAIYVLFLLVFRVSGKRALAQMTSFDFVLLLIVAEAAQQALLVSDQSLTNAAIVIVTLAVLDIALSRWKFRSPRLDRVLEGLPVLLLADGQPLAESLQAEGVDLDDILTAARATHGLERLEQIKYAVLERNGGISIIPA